MTPDPDRYAWLPRAIKYNRYLSAAMAIVAGTQSFVVAQALLAQRYEPALIYGLVLVFVCAVLLWNIAQARHLQRLYDKLRGLGYDI